MSDKKTGPLLGPQGELPQAKDQQARSFWPSVATSGGGVYWVNPSPKPLPPAAPAPDKV